MYVRSSTLLLYQFLDLRFLLQHDERMSSNVHHSGRVWTSSKPLGTLGME